MPTQIESHRLHLQVRHVQLLRAKCWQEKKSKEKWNNVLRSNELRAINENTRGERKIYVDGGALPSFPFSSVKLKFAQKHFMVSHKKNQ